MSSNVVNVYNLNMITSKLDDLIWQYRTTAKDIAESTGISRNTISCLRNNKTKRYDSSTLNALCKYFNCKISDILEYIPD
ncbi:MAG: helix-turn-helix domain-containing protein [Candidatus Gastranaerophilaceae bacterium]